MNTESYIATFNSTHHALKFEKSAKEHEIKIIIMPVPRSIAASCGLAVKFSGEYLNDVMRLVKDEALNYAAIYSIEDTQGKKDYSKIDAESL